MKPLLENLGDELLQTLKTNGRIRIFNENEEIFAEGETASSLPIVLAGKVKMVRFLEIHREVIIGIFQSGEMFAVPPVFDGEPYPATAIAMEETKILLLAREDFLRLLRVSSEFSVAVIGWLCVMLREKTATIQNLATASAEHRAGNVLLRLSQKDALANKPVKISLRRQDIAEMAGLTTETTIRAVRKLAEKNLIKIQHGKIIIEDTARLRDYLSH